MVNGYKWWAKIVPEKELIMNMAEPLCPDCTITPPSEFSFPPPQDSCGKL